MSTATKSKTKTGLTPTRGSNPERQPVPRDPYLEALQRREVLCPELCYITRFAVRHPVGVYQCTGGEGAAEREAIRACFGFNGPAYQVMRWDEGPGPGLAFWRWHLNERPQWYDTPEAACAAYVASYRQWATAKGLESLP